MKCKTKITKVTDKLVYVDLPASFRGLEGDLVEITIYDSEEEWKNAS